MSNISIEARFEGHPIIEYGTAPIPVLLIWHYNHLYLSDSQFAIISHILSRKWTKEAPYPTLPGMAMSAKEKTRRAYVRDLRQRGLIFTKRLYWVTDDLKKFPYAKPGKVRANAWYFSSLLHNLVRIHNWLEEGKSAEDFVIEIPIETASMFLKGEFHDTPATIAEAIKNGSDQLSKGQGIPLLSQNSIVGSTIPKATSRKATGRKTDSQKEESFKEEESLDKKNQLAPKSKKPLTPAQAMFEAIAQVCKIDIRFITEDDRGKVNQTEKLFRDEGVKPEEIIRFGDWWSEHDWRGKLHQPPQPAQIRSTWGQFNEWRETSQNGATDYSSLISVDDYKKIQEERSQ